MKAYESTINFCTKELTAKERIKFKDMSEAISIDEVLDFDGDLILKVDYYGKLDIHNEKAKDNTDYSKYVLVTPEGDKYVTGSETFARQFEDIVTELVEAGEEIEIKIFRRESKNYKDKYFITCTVA